MGKSDNKEEYWGTVLDGLKRVYKEYLFPLEEMYRFNEFHSPFLEDADFDCCPMIMVIGQYSVGKTTFIKYIIDKKTSDMQISAEQTTDQFMAFMYGEFDNQIPGNAVVMDKTKPFRNLQRFGAGFLDKFVVSQTKAEALENLIVIDTPGILSSQMQGQEGRGYDFAEVLEWFAERVDRIILLFDAHKLDISEEFRRSIDKLKPYDEKVRIALNKSDMVDTQTLLRVYGSLMWSLGKVIHRPEVKRVYVGSFWNEPLKNTQNTELFEQETKDLIADIQQLPRDSAKRKLSDLCGRFRQSRVHAMIIDRIRKQQNLIFMKDSKRKDTIKKLKDIYEEIQQEGVFHPSDFPDLEYMQNKLSKFDFSKFNNIKKNHLSNISDTLDKNINRLLSMVPKIGENKAPVKLGIFAEKENTPFAYGREQGIDEGSLSTEWIVLKDKPTYDAIFAKLPKESDGKLGPGEARKALLASKLPHPILSRIWKLADYDRDGKLDDEEFALGMHLCALKKKGYDIPESLPDHLIPPKHRSTNQNGSSNSNLE